MSYTTFSSPLDGPYIETYLVVEGRSAEFILNSNSKYQASIQVIVLFKNQAGEISNYDKYELFSPELDDTTDVNFTFIDQQRYSLKQGNYDFELQIWDKNSQAKPYVNLQPLSINYPDNEITISGIQLIESVRKSDEPNMLTKAGYDLVPFVVNYYPGQMNKLTYYVELYNTDKILQPEEKFLVTSYISTIEKDKP